MNRLVLLGTGCPAPSHMRYGPSTLLQINEKNYLFDVGSGVTQRLNKFGLKSSDIDEVFITHMHSDHIVDLYQLYITCLLYTSPSPRDVVPSRMPSSA